MAPKIAVIFYSVYSHNLTVAEAAVKAVEDAGAEVRPASLSFTRRNAADVESCLPG